MNKENIIIFFTICGGIGGIAASIHLWLTIKEKSELKKSINLFKKLNINAQDILRSCFPLSDSEFRCHYNPHENILEIGTSMISKVHYGNIDLLSAALSILEIHGFIKVTKFRENINQIERFVLTKRSKLKKDN